MNAADRTATELADAKLAIATAAHAYPTTVLLAMLDQLVEVACGRNPALKNYMRLQFYRGVLTKLEAARDDGAREIVVPEKLLRTGAVVMTTPEPKRGSR